MVVVPLYLYRLSFYAHSPHYSSFIRSFVPPFVLLSHLYFSSRFLPLFPVLLLLTFCSLQPAYYFHISISMQDFIEIHPLPLKFILSIASHSSFQCLNESSPFPRNLLASFRLPHLVLNKISTLRCKVLNKDEFATSFL